MASTICCSWRNRNKALVDIWGNQATITELEERFAYMFLDRQGYPQVLRPHVYAFNAPLTIGDITVTPFDQDHGTCRTVGSHGGDTAYSTDVVGFDEAALKTLAGIKTWVLDAAGYKMPENEIQPAIKVHMTLTEFFGANEIVRAEKSLPDASDTGDGLPDAAERIAARL